MTAREPLRRSPCTRLGDTRADRGPVAAYLTSSAPNVLATVLLAVWLCEHPVHHPLWRAAFLFTVLVAVTPGLIRAWEGAFARLLVTLDADPAWDGGRVRAAVAAVDRAFWPLVAFTLGFAVVFFTFFAARGMARLGATGLRGRLAVGLVGACFAYSIAVGIWIVCRVVAVARGGLTGRPRWDPFRRSGFGTLARFAAVTGAMFSVGSLAVPGWIEAGRGGPAVAHVMTAFGTVLFLGTGAVAFLIPQALLSRYAAAERLRRLDEVGAALSAVADEMVASSEAVDRLGPRFSALAAVQDAVERRNVLPGAPVTALRALATVVVPIASLWIQATARR